MDDEAKNADVSPKKRRQKPRHLMRPRSPKTKRRIVSVRYSEDEYEALVLAADQAPFMRVYLHPGTEFRAKNSDRLEARMGYQDIGTVGNNCHQS